MGKVNVERQKTDQLRPGPTNDKLIQVSIQSDAEPAVPDQTHTSVLVADDDLFYLSFIETILFPFNYKIIHAKDGQEAVNMYQTNDDIKLILMDIQMPVKDGLTATKEIRK